MKSIKNVIVIQVIVMGLLQVSCNTQQQKQYDIQSRINSVENGLLPAVIMNGEKGWNILERMKYYNVPGLSIAVINNGEVEWAKGYGTREAGKDRPVTTGTIFQTGSTGKTIAALTTLSLVNKGILDLDKDVNLYLKSWKVPENEYTRNEKVTIRRILSHTAGLNEDNSEVFQTGSVLPSIAELLNINKIEAVNKPGEGYAYSGAGYMILEQLIEDVTGKPYSLVANDEVLKPIGMNDTYFSIILPDTLLTRAALAHKNDGSGYKTIYPLFPCFAPGTCNWSTATDLAELLIEIQKSFYGKSNKVLPQTLAREMMTNMSLTYGLGIKLIKDNGSTFIGHSGDFYGFHAAIYGYLENGKGIAVMTNGDNGVLLYNEIIRSVSVTYNWPGCKPEIASIKQIDLQSVKEFMGFYYLPAKMDIMNIYLKDGKLSCDLLGDYGTEMIQIGPSKFFVKDNDGTVEFVKNAIENYFDVEFRRIGVVMKGSLMPGFDLLGTQRFEEAIKLIMEKKEEYSRPQYEGIINNIGYSLLNTGKTENAIAVFRLNTIFFPGSWNAFDSLGEAYMIAGKNKLSVGSYEKSLKMNPQNSNAIAKIKELIKNDIN